jgi:hypothetical protein
MPPRQGPAPQFRNGPPGTLCAVEDVVAIEVVLDSGQRRYFMTWGRILDPVDGHTLAELVLKQASGFDLGGRPVEAKVCSTLAEARDQPYFYEGLVDFARHTIPFGDHYESWRKVRETAMREGRELYNLGAR